ncbi:MAG: DUF309 domain-containing protein [Deinococcales bacterium]
MLGDRSSTSHLSPHFASPSEQKAWNDFIALFEAGAYWEAHEALEALWLKAAGSDKDFYAGLILLAAALVKARRDNSAQGGRRNYAKALAKLATIPDVYQNLHVRWLEAEVHAALRNSDLKPSLPFKVD